MKFHPSVIFTRNAKSTTPTGLESDCFYTPDPNASADVSCPALYEVLFRWPFEKGVEYVIGYGSRKDTIHIADDFTLYAVCGWRGRERSALTSGQVNPIVRYDTKYKLCLKCRKKLEEGK